MKIERWIKPNNEWVHIVFLKDKTYFNGQEIEFVDHFENQFPQEETHES